MKNYSNQTDITKITRLKKSENDISCDMGKFLYQKELSTLIKQIRSRLTYERTVFVLFSWFLFVIFDLVAKTLNFGETGS